MRTNKKEKPTIAERIKRIRNLKKVTVDYKKKIEAVLKGIKTKEMSSEDKIKVNGYLREKIDVCIDLVQNLEFAENYIDQYGEDDTYRRGIGRKINSLMHRLKELENGELGLYFKSLLEKGLQA